MGDVAIKYRIMPVDIESDLDAIITGIGTVIPGHVRLAATEIKPIAFGLKSIEAVVILDDKAGGADEIEEQIAAITGVGSVEVLETGLV